MPTSTDGSASELIRKVPSAVRPTVRAARHSIRAVAPKAKEIAYRGVPPRSSRTMWKLLRYAIDGLYVVAIGTFPDHVSVFFPRGRELDDGTGLLEGGGKEFRFITLRSPADATRPAVKRMVRKAFALGRSSIRGQKR